MGHTSQCWKSWLSFPPSLWDARWSSCLHVGSLARSGPPTLRPTHTPVGHVPQSSGYLLLRAFTAFAVWPDPPWAAPVASVSLLLLVILTQMSTCLTSLALVALKCWAVQSLQKTVAKLVSAAAVVGVAYAAKNVLTVCFQQGCFCRCADHVENQNYLMLQKTRKLTRRLQLKCPRERPPAWLSSNKEAWVCCFDRCLHSSWCEPVADADLVAVTALAMGHTVVHPAGSGVPACTLTFPHVFTQIVVVG